MGETVKTFKERHSLAAADSPVARERGRGRALPAAVVWSELGKDRFIATASGQAAFRQASVDARAALKEAASAAADAAAHALFVAEALEDALAILGQPGGTQRPLAGSGAFMLADLSPREREVLALVAEGRSNKSIADTLFVSPNTVKTHVASLLQKLNASTRAQLAVMAARHGLRFQSQ